VTQIQHRELLQIELPQIESIVVSHFRWNEMPVKLFAVLDGGAGSIRTFKNNSKKRAACSAVFHRNATQLFLRSCQ
jgi:hypothetical protein